MLFIILLNEQRNFSKINCVHRPFGLLSRPQLVRNHFLVTLPKRQQVDMVQRFGHFRWSLKRQSPDYKKEWLYKSLCNEKMESVIALKLLKSLRWMLPQSFKKVWPLEKIFKKSWNKLIFRANFLTFAKYQSNTSWLKITKEEWTLYPTGNWFLNHVCCNSCRGCFIFRYTVVSFPLDSHPPYVEEKLLKNTSENSKLPDLSPRFLSCW